MGIKFGMKSRECQEMMAWVQEKLIDYADTEPEEDEIRIDLRFRKGKQEQHKCRSWTRSYRNNNEIGELTSRNYVRMRDILEPIADKRLGFYINVWCMCKKCGEWMTTEDKGIDELIFNYCPNCGEKFDVDEYREKLEKRNHITKEEK